MTERNERIAVVGAGTMGAGIAQVAALAGNPVQRPNLPSDTGLSIGPLEWGDRWEAAVVLEVLDNLHNSYRDPRYRASTLLRRTVQAKGRLR